MDAELTQTVRAAMPYAETLGLEVLAASPDEVRGRIAWEERLTTAAGLADDARLEKYLAKATGRFLTVPDPRLAVLRDIPRAFLATRIRLTEPESISPVTG